MLTNAIIIRTSWIYSEYGNNFVDTMLRLGRERDELNIINDQVGSPTYATDLAEAVLDIINHKDFIKIEQETQVYHYSNEGMCSWYEFAKGIFKLAKVECTVRAITTEQYPAPARRPKNTVMNKFKITTIYNFHIPNWKASLASMIVLLKVHTNTLTVT